MSEPTREEILDHLMAAEATGDAAGAEAWRRYLASVTPPARLGAPELPPVPIVFDAPTLRLAVTPEKKRHLTITDPSSRRLLAMVPHASVADVGAAPGRLWFVGAFRGQTRMEVEVGGADAAAAARAIRQKLRLPRTPHDVSVAALRADPKRHHGAWIRTVGTWTHGFEHSELAGAWLYAARADRFPSPAEVRVVGRWTYGPSGHLGVSPAGLEALSIEPA